MYTCTVFPFLDVSCVKACSYCLTLLLGRKIYRDVMLTFLLALSHLYSCSAFMFIYVTKFWKMMSVDFCCSKQTENEKCRLEREQQVWWYLPWFSLDLLKLGNMWCQHLLFFLKSVASVWSSIMKEILMIVSVGLEKTLTPVHWSSRRHWKTLCKALYKSFSWKLIVLGRLGASDGLGFCHLSCWSLCNPVFMQVHLSYLTLIFKMLFSYI